MQTRIDELILKHQKGKLTPEESIELKEFTGRSEDNRQLVDHLTDAQHLFEAIQRSRALNVEVALQKAKNDLFRPTIFRARYYRMTAAAVVVIALSLAWLFFSKNADKKEVYTQEQNTSSPFHQAKLTLGNGQVLKLNELPNGSLGDDRMLTKKDGQLIYPPNYHPGQPEMNTLETLKGSYFSLQLPDGSTAWLNSASFIQYPNSFTGDKRVVVIQGEVYFDVAKNPSKPFIVQSVADGSETEVVGTRFTVNAYKGDNIVRITLLEGKVKVKGKSYLDSLKAGEQLIARAGRKVEKITIDSAEARVQGWKENKFKWVQTDLTTILEDLSRWYGYSLKYNLKVPVKTYTVIIDRSESLPNIFKVLRTGTELDFKLEETTIVVYRDVKRGK